MTPAMTPAPAPEATGPAMDAARPATFQAAEPEGLDDADWALARFDPSRPHPARTCDYWLGGKDHFEADRRIAEQVAALAPWVRAGARANRAFLTRAIAYLARNGVGQFLDCGAGLPSAGNGHEIAQRIIPTARTVYADNDPNKSGCVHAGPSTARETHIAHDRGPHLRTRRVTGAPEPGTALIVAVPRVVWR